MKKGMRLLLISLCLCGLLMGGCAVREQSKATEEDSKVTKEELKDLSADELFDLFIDNGLIINERLAECWSEEEIKEMLKSDFDLLVQGITAYGDLMYFEFADSVKETYEKIVTE
ncbi:MAG: hypothetical protein IJR00_08575 [Lachnospiraceae bacterium]|nr:hypothetical protein [Lachnospiraceae bacterium]